MQEETFWRVLAQTNGRISKVTAGKVRHIGRRKIKSAFEKDPKMIEKLLDKIPMCRQTLKSVPDPSGRPQNTIVKRGNCVSTSSNRQELA